MAITHVQGQVLWSTASSLSVTSATEVVSDVFPLDDSCVAFDLSVSANNAGTPASGDTAIFKILWSTGDILGDTGDDFDTSEHAELVATIDTFTTNTPGENPGRRTVFFPLTARKFKITCTCANAATRNITIRARVQEHRVA